MSNNIPLGVVGLHCEGPAPLTRMFQFLNYLLQGIVIHRNTNIVLINGLFADNHIGIDLDRATDIEIRDTKIIGESDSYKKLMERQDVASVGRANRIYAIDLHTWKTEDWGAFSLDNIDISGFDNVKPTTSKIIHFDDLNLKGGQFEMYTAFSNIKIHGNNRQIDFCTIEEAGIDTAYIIDLTGNLSPASFPTTATGTLISNGENMLKFVDAQQCTNMPEGCYTYCRDTCFRSVRFTTEQNKMGGGHQLKVCERNNPSKCSFFVGATRGGARDPRSFIAHLPVGKTYDAVFLDPSGNEVAPSGDDFRFDENFCSSVSPFEVSFKSGPNMVHQVIPDPSQPTPDPSQPGAEANPFSFLNWFFTLINAILKALLGGLWGGN